MRTRLTLAILLALCVTAAAQEIVPLGWDYASDIPLRCFRLYQGTISGIYTPVMEVSGLTYADLPYIDGFTNYCVVTAISTNGVESDYSNEIEFFVVHPPPPLKPPAPVLWIRKPLFLK